MNSLKNNQSLNKGKTNVYVDYKLIKNWYNNSSFFEVSFFFNFSKKYFSIKSVFNV